MMNQSQSIISILLIGLVLFGVAPMAVTAEEHNTTSTENETIEAGPGSQIATIVQSMSANIQDEVQDKAREIELEQASTDTSKAKVLKEQSEDIREESAEISQDYKEAVKQRQTGNISKQEFAQRVATLNTRADNTREDIKSIKQESRTVQKDALESSQFNRSVLQSSNESIGIASSNGAAVVEQKFLGNERVENLSVEADTRGLSVAAEASDGMVVQNVDKRADTDESYNLSTDEALEIVDSRLSDGDWNLVESTADDGAYEFEFEKSSNSSSGEAEFTVDASSERVIKGKLTERDASDPEGVTSAFSTGEASRQSETEARIDTEPAERAEERREEQRQYDYNITEEEARSIALDNLRTTGWNQIAVNRYDGEYRFAFVKQNQTPKRFAEIDVDATNRSVVEKEVEEEEKEYNYSITEEEARSLALSNLSTSSWNELDVTKDDGAYTFILKKENETAESRAQVFVYASGSYPVRTDIDTERKGYDYDITEEEARLIALESLETTGWSQLNTDKEDGAIEFTFLSKNTSELDLIAEVIVDTSEETVTSKSIEYADDRGEPQGEYNITQQEARQIAVGSLGDTDWEQEAASRDDGNYRFTFVQQSETSEKNAQVIVNASTGEIIQSQQSLEGKVYDITEEEAREIALGSLTKNDWETEAVSRDNGEYRFEFERGNNSFKQTAQVIVNSSREEVVQDSIYTERKRNAEDNPGLYPISENDAREIALTNLSKNDWREDAVGQSDGDYRFKFERGNRTVEQTAQVLVNATTREVAYKQITTDRERDRGDNPGLYPISEDDAREIALTNLSKNDWVKETSTQRDGEYRFAFERENKSFEQSASVVVNASTEEVVEKDILTERKRNESDNPGLYPISEDEAREIALTNLSKNDWEKEASTKGDGEYRFAFERENKSFEQTAQMVVNASREEVVQKLIRTEKKNGDKQPESNFSLSVVKQTNKTVSIKAVRSGDPVEGADVIYDDEFVGETSRNGTYTVEVPPYGDVEIVAEVGQQEARVEVERG